MAYTTLNSLLTAIANAIRSKKGTTETINAQNFPTEILSIQNDSQLFFNHTGLNSGMTISDVDVGFTKEAKKIYIHVFANPDYGKRNYGLKGSNDNITWVDIINYPQNNGNIIQSIENTDAYRYYRCWCDGNTVGQMTSVGIAVMV